MDKLLAIADNLTVHGKHYWEWANGQVIRIYVNAYSGVDYPAPTAPAPPAMPAPVPEPTPWLAIMLSLVVTSIIAIVIVWWYGFRNNDLGRIR